MEMAWPQCDTPLVVVVVVGAATAMYDKTNKL
jgi:hypothetical protein